MQIPRRGVSMWERPHQRASTGWRVGLIRKQNCTAGLAAMSIPMPRAKPTEIDGARLSNHVIVNTPQQAARFGTQACRKCGVGLARQSDAFGRRWENMTRRARLAAGHTLHQLENKLPKTVQGLHIRIMRTGFSALGAHGRRIAPVSGGVTPATALAQSRRRTFGNAP